jgi:hypothetical protein
MSVGRAGGRPSAARRIPWTALAVLAVAAACQWSAPRGDLAGTGSAPGSSGVGVEAVDDLVERWQASHGPSPQVPVVSGNTVVVASGTGLRAFDAAGCGQATCAPIWQDDGAFGQPTIDGDLVYVIKGSYPAAYDLRGGATCSGTPRRCGPRWTGSEGAGWVLAGHGIVVATGATETYVYDAGDGSGCPGGVCSPTRRLESPACDWIFGCLSSLPSMGAGLIVFGFQGAEEWSVGGHVAAYDLAGAAGCTAAAGIDVCRPLWSRDVGSVASPPAIVDGTVVVDSTAWIFDDIDGEYALQDHRVSTFALDGTPGWSRTDASIAEGQLAVAGGTVFDTDGRTVRALDLDTGSLVWTARMGSFVRGVAESAGVLYVSTALGVFALDASGTVGCGGAPTTCTPVATVTGTGSSTPVAISNGLVWVADSTGDVRAFGLEP